MNITLKGSIEPIPIEDEKSEGLVLFQERSNLHETINGFKVYINQYAWDAFLNHSNNVYKQTKHEAQGIFLGKYYKDKYGEFAVATEYSEGKGESSHAYVGMSEECLAEISKKCSAEKLLMLIWIHTHPNFGVWYSSTDYNCIKTNFYMPFQSGIVVDIIRRESKGYKVEMNDANEFTGYYIYYYEEKRLSKPYAISVELKSNEVKKNESSISFESPTKEILTEIHTVKKELTELQSMKKEFAEFQGVKKELTELKSILNEKLEQSKTQKQVDPVEEHKEYLEEIFGSIKLQLSRQKDYTEYLENLISNQEKFKIFLFRFLIGLSVLFGLGIISFIYSSNQFLNIEQNHFKDSTNKMHTLQAK